MNEGENKKLSTKKQNIIKLIVLSLLTIQTSSFFVLTRYSRGILKENYIRSTLIVTSECIKLFASMILIYNLQSKKNEPYWSHVFDVIKNSLVLSPPALMYFFQNFLVSYSLQNIRTAYFTVLNQLKVLTTAFFSVVILRRKLSVQKWISLVILLIGLVLVKWEDNDSSEDVSSNIKGLITAIIIPILSGLSGIYMELFVKKKQSKYSIWDRNLQLSVYSVVFALATTFIFDYELIMEKGYFYGYTASAIILPVLLGFGGLIVALVIKFSNNIIKGFATSISIIISTLFSTFFWGFKINLFFVIGVSFVIFSIFFYMDIIDINKIFGIKKVIKVDESIFSEEGEEKV